MGEIIGFIFLVACSVSVVGTLLFALFNPKNKDEVLGFMYILVCFAVTIVAIKILSILLSYII